MVAAMATSAVQAAPIESITATVTGEGTPLPPVLAKRMQAAVQTAADHIYVGKDTAEVAASTDAYRRVTADIINRILYGYTVDGMTITPGVNGQLAVTVKPYGHGKHYAANQEGKAKAVAKRRAARKRNKK